MATNNVVNTATGASGTVLTGNGVGVTPTFQAAAFTAATQAEQEAGSSTTVAVTPGRQQFHPSAAKAWVIFDVAAAIGLGYNVASISDNGTGKAGVNWTVAFSSASYTVGIAQQAANAFCLMVDSSAGTPQAAGAVQLLNLIALTSGVVDPVLWHVSAYGDQ